jgi:hypothetical protein
MKASRSLSYPGPSQFHAQATQPGDEEVELVNRERASQKFSLSPARTGAQETNEVVVESLPISLLREVGCK